MLAAGYAATAAFVGLLAGLDPKLAIGAALGFAFVLVAFTSLAAGLTVFTMLGFLEFALPSGATLSLSKAAGLLLALAWLARVATRHSEETFFDAHPLASYVLFAFLGWGLLSISWSETTSGTLGDLSRYFLNMTVIVIAFTALRERRYVYWIFGAWIVGAAIAAVYGLLTKPSVAPDEAYRLSSSVGNANVLATVLVAGLVLALAGGIAARHSPAIRAAAWSTAVLALFSSFFTGSRSGAIAFGVVIVASVLFAGRKWRGRVFLAAAATAVIAVMSFFAFAPEAIKQRVTQTAPGQVQATDGRGTIWQVGWRMVEAHPIHGVGLGSFQTSSIHYVLQPGTLERSDQVIDTPKVAHNIFLQVLAEEGIIGLALFLAVLAFPIGCALRAARNFSWLGDFPMEVMSRALVVALMGILAADFFASEQFQKLLWILLAMGPVMLAVSRPAGKDPARPTPRRVYNL